MNCMCGFYTIISVTLLHDLPGLINDMHASKPTLYADDTSIIITHPNAIVFKKEINSVIEKISNWFRTNLLTLNFNKTYYLNFSAKTKLEIDMQLSYKGNPISNTLSTNFLGLTLDSTLSWNLHVEQLSSKLHSACYVIRLLKSIISTNNLRTVYFAYAHSIITYGIVFWGNSPYSNNIFKLQKRIIRIIMKVDNRVSCRDLFKKLNILPLHSQYILSLLLFVVKNMDIFTINSDVHSINTRHRSDLHPPLVKLTKYKKGVHYSGIKIFNSLPLSIKKLAWDVKKFKVTLKRFLLTGLFYTPEEYFDWTSRSDLGTYV